MILRNELEIGADVETVWAHLLDMETVAGCVPGAKIDGTEPPNVYRGTIRIKIGPMTVDYRGRATLSEVDEVARSATILLRAREAKGQGSALATVRNRLEPTAAGGTRVIAETDLQITGPQAQFGKGVMEDVGSRVLVEFSRRLEARIAAGRGVAGGGAEHGDDGSRTSAATGGSGASPAGGEGGGASGVSTPGPDAEVLDLGRILSQSVAGRIALAGGFVAGAVAAAVLVVALLRRR
ncbi:MAG: SRPBCC family protein [Acidimicrobiales bacterium]